MQKDISIHSVAGGIVVQASKHIEFRAGDSTLTLKPNGTIAVNGKLVDMDGTQSVKINSGSSKGPSHKLDAKKVDKVFTTPTEKGSAIPKITVEPHKPPTIEPFHSAGSTARESSNSEFSTPNQQPPEARNWGLGNDDVMKDFICKSRRIRSAWNDLTRGQKKIAFLNLVNKTLTSQGIPKTKVALRSFAGSASGAAFGGEDWEMEINENYFSSAHMSDQTFDELTALIYHEAAHSEQMWLGSQAKQLPENINTRAYDVVGPTKALAAESAFYDKNFGLSNHPERNQFLNEVRDSYFHLIEAKTITGKKILTTKASIVYRTRDKAYEYLLKSSKIRDELRAKADDLSRLLGDEYASTKRAWSEYHEADNDYHIADKKYRDADNDYKELPMEKDSYALQNKMLDMMKKPNLCINTKFYQPFNKSYWNV